MQPPTRTYPARGLFTPSVYGVPPVMVSRARHRKYARSAHLENRSSGFRMKQQRAARFRTVLTRVSLSRSPTACGVVRLRLGQWVLGVRSRLSGCPRNSAKRNSPPRPRCCRSPGRDLMVSCLGSKSKRDLPGRWETPTSASDSDRLGSRARNVRNQVRREIGGGLGEPAPTQSALVAASGGLRRQKSSHDKRPSATLGSREWPNGRSGLDRPLFTCANAVAIRAASTGGQHRGRRIYSGAESENIDATRLDKLTRYENIMPRFGVFSARQKAPRL